MNTQGFYKKDNNEILFTPDHVSGLNYYLYAAEKDTYTYPIDGWVWADNIDDAITKFTNNNFHQPPSFGVVPEGYKLKTSIEDENEFNKLITLVQLGLQQGQLTTSTIIKIKDSDGIAHEVIVSRFLEIMIEYGFFCYNNRNL